MAKKGDIMDNNNEFDILENNSQDVIERIAEEFPPRDEKEKEMVFKMSEKKFNNKISEADEESNKSVSGVERYDRPVWKRILNIAAAAAVLISGTAGGIKAMKHFSNVSEKNDNISESKTAPFGDFAESGYKVCDYSKEPLFSIICNNSMNAQDVSDKSAETETDPVAEYDTVSEGEKDVTYNNKYIYVYDGTEITENKRQKLADFFNDFDGYEPINTADIQNDLNSDITKYDADEESFIVFNEDNDTEQKNLASDAPNPDSPFFEWVESDRVKSISITEKNNVGILCYVEFGYTYDNSQYSTTYSDYICKEWEIDYDLFEKSITDILNEEETAEEITEEPTTDEKPTEPVTSETAPFGNFSETEFFVDSIPASKNDKDGMVTVEIKDGGYTVDDVIYEVDPDEPISLDKRKQLEQLFNSYKWETIELHPELVSQPTTEWLSDWESITFNYLTDTEFSTIVLDSYTNTLFYDSIAINQQESSADPDHYLCTDRSTRTFNIYKADFNYFKEKITEILGDEYSDVVYRYNFFTEKNWRLSISDYEILTSLKTSKEDRNNFYDILKNYDWKHVKFQDIPEYNSIIQSLKFNSENFALWIWQYDTGITEVTFMSAPDPCFVSAGTARYNEYYYCTNDTVIDNLLEYINSQGKDSYMFDESPDELYDITIEFNFFNDFDEWVIRDTEYDFSDGYNAIYHDSPFSEKQVCELKELLASAKWRSYLGDFNTYEEYKTLFAINEERSMYFNIYITDDGYTMWCLNARKPDPNDPNNALYDVQYDYINSFFFSYDKSLVEKIKAIFNE